MAKYGTDPVLRELVRAANESGQARVPVTVSVHGTAVAGVLIAQDVYFAELAEGTPLLSALTPGSDCWARTTPRTSRRRPASTCTFRRPGGTAGSTRTA